MIVDFFQIGMVDNFFDGNSLIWKEGEHFFKKIDGYFGVVHECAEKALLLGFLDGIKDAGGHFALELVDFFWFSGEFDDFFELVECRVAIEDHISSEYFTEDASEGPYINSSGVVAGSKEDLR